MTPSSKLWRSELAIHPRLASMAARIGAADPSPFGWRLPS